MTSPSVTLTPAQEAIAVEILAFATARGPGRPDVATLQGYAGVGKTTLVGEVVRRLEESGELLPVVACAPTHKAVSILGEKIGNHRLTLATLHSLLGLQMHQLGDGSQVAREKAGACSLHEFALAIVDESSMIGEGLFQAVLSKRSRCRILFVGDPAQLPPVEGEELSKAFSSEEVPTQWRLTEVMRQAIENPIIRIATAARSCIDEAAPFGLAELGAQLTAGDDQYIAVTTGGVAEVSRLVADAMQHGQDTRAMAWDNASVQAINATVHGLLYQGAGPYPVGTQLMAQEAFGAVDIANRIRKTNVRNSALVQVLESELKPHPDDRARAAWRLVVEADGKKLECWVADDQRAWQDDIRNHFAEHRRLKMRETMTAGTSEAQALREQARAESDAGWALRTRYAPLRYAYAMTVHKAQGSTFDAVVIDWMGFARCRDIQLRNRLIYVALTRARTFAVVCA